MRVILAGYNLDHEIIMRLRESSRDPAGRSDSQTIDPTALTPETLSAAYARISRDPAPIPELRARALSDVADARRSNQRIVFGFGHASVAEHAVFNLDILDVSRLAIEALEMTRLGSYTEKSQRYILLERDCIVPAEVSGTPLEGDFRELLSRQQEGYRQAYRVLTRHYQRSQPAAWAGRRRRRLLEGAAKEDARYFLGLATTGQLGATLNARSVEATARRLAASAVEEVRRLGDQLHRVTAAVAPSLVRYTEATAHRRETSAALARRVGELTASAPPPPESPVADQRAVRLIHSAPEGELLLLTALIHGHGELSWERAASLAWKMTAEMRRELVRESLCRLAVHESTLRHYELPDFTFELILSASCFAQLKRHRMATLLCQAYRPQLGVTLPPVFGEVALSGPFEEVRQLSEEVYTRMLELAPHAAPYALTNAHRRRVLFKVNARELYHLSRLRLDEHAQWDIRALAIEMVRQARERMPLTMMLAAGKSCFDEVRSREV
jgi:thymidylate synthase ThyX